MHKDHGEGVSGQVKSVCSVFPGPEVSQKYPNLFSDGIFKVVFVAVFHKS